MKNTNSVTLIGRLTRDPEINYTASGTAVCKFSIANNEKYKDVEKVYYFDIVTFGKTAEVCNQYIKKGSLIAVTGRLVQDRWQDQQTGQNRSKISVTADQVEFLNTGSQSDGSGGGQGNYNNSQNNGSQPQNYGNQGQQPQQQQQNNGNMQQGQQTSGYNQYNDPWADKQ